MTNRELDNLIDWCRQKMEKEKNNPYGLTGKRREGYKEAMLAVMSHLHDLKERNGISKPEPENAANVIPLIERYLQYHCRVFRWDGSPEGYIKADVDQMIEKLKKKYKREEEE